MERFMQLETANLNLKYECTKCSSDIGLANPTSLKKKYLIFHTIDEGRILDQPIIKLRNLCGVFGSKLQLCCATCKAVLGYSVKREYKIDIYAIFIGLREVVGKAELVSPVDTRANAQPGSQQEQPPTHDLQHDREAQMETERGQPPTEWNAEAEQKTKTNPEGEGDPELEQQGLLTESNGQTDSVELPDQEREAELDSQPEANRDSEPEKEAKAEAEQNMEIKAQPEPEQESEEVDVFRSSEEHKEIKELNEKEAEIDQEAETEQEVQPEAKTDSKIVETQCESEPFKAGAEPEAKTDREIPAQLESVPETKAAAQLELKQEVQISEIAEREAKAGSEISEIAERECKTISVEPTKVEAEPEHVSKPLTAEPEPEHVSKPLTAEGNPERVSKPEGKLIKAGEETEPEKPQPEPEADQLSKKVVSIFPIKAEKEPIKAEKEPTKAEKAPIEAEKEPFKEVEKETIKEAEKETDPKQPQPEPKQEQLEDSKKGLAVEGSGAGRKKKMNMRRIKREKLNHKCWSAEHFADKCDRAPKCFDCEKEGHMACSCPN